MQNRQITDLREEHFELITAYDATIEAAKQSAHDKAISCIVKGRALVGVPESSPFPGIKKTALILGITAACGYGGMKYIESHGLVFGESVPAESVNLGYTPPPDTFVSDHDRATAPVSPPAAPAKPACSPKLTGAALMWCQKQNRIAPLRHDKQTSVEQIIGRGNHG